MADEKQPIPMADLLAVRLKGGGLTRMDGWGNPYTGLGTTRDKGEFTAFTRDRILTDQELEELYHFDPLSARIVDWIPNEALRENFAIEVEGDGGDVTADKAMVRCEELRVLEAVKSAWVWARDLGGAAVLVGAQDGKRTHEPLVPEQVKSVEWLAVVNKRQLTIDTRYTDPKHPKYNQPETYRLGAQAHVPAGSIEEVVSGTLIHESRLVFFPGAPTSPYEKQLNGGWDHSVLQKVVRPLIQVHSVLQAGAQLLTGIAIPKFKIKNLFQMVTSGEKQAFFDRMAAIELNLAGGRLVMIDTEEEFEREETPLSQMPEMIELYIKNLAGSVPMSVTRLMGVSPAGLNATGESDIRHDYDTIESERETVCLPRLEQIVRLILIANGGEPEEWACVFPPLWQPTAKEKAEEAQRTAETAKLYFDMGYELENPPEGFVKKATPEPVHGQSPPGTPPAPTPPPAREPDAEDEEEEPPPVQDSSELREDLQRRGRALGEWETGPGACDLCKSLDGKEMPMDANVEEIAHPGCTCEIKHIEYETPRQGPLERS